MNLFIRGGRLLDPASGFDGPADLRCEAGRIVERGPGLTAVPGDTVLDARGCWVVPGLVDVHVHLREPGEEYKEDVASGSLAAAAGGYTSIVAMPNTQPVIDSGPLVGFIKQRGEAAGHCRVLPAGAATLGQLGRQLAPYGELKRAGAVALTDDGHPIADAAIMRAALEYAKDFDLPVLTHAEDPGLSRDGHMHEGALSVAMGIRGIPSISEEAAVARDLMLARYTGGRLHVCHVSTAGAVDLIRAAKAAGVRVTAEATPHHFCLTDAAVRGYATAAKMNPPLRDLIDREGVRRGLADGTLDAIATDHAPHSPMEKAVPFADACHGVIGLQTALPLALGLCRDGLLTPLQLIDRLTTGPCRALGLPYGRLGVGDVADLTLIDPLHTWTFDSASLRSKSCNSPFWGQSMQGAARATICAGAITHAIDA
jgi:dihydroorotase